jgi:hypothetical protein
VSGLLLDDVARFIRRFVVLSDAQAATGSLWVAHTHAIESFDTTPYLAITSAEKRSGKTRKLEVLELLVREPLPTANISDAALFRAISQKTPTLLFDEVDAVFRARDREDLRGLLNAGHRRGAVAYRMGGARMTTLEPFPVFCAKAFAGIGDCLPDTIRDRAIGIRLQRRTRDEAVERFRRRDVEPEAHALRDQLADWLEPQLDHLHALRPDLPDELDDRAQDSWEPLLAIAALSGGDWPERARRAALELSTGEGREDDSLTARLLGDIFRVFSEASEERLKTSELLARLCEIEESPWGDWYGKQLSPQGLSRLLKPYRIRTMPVRAHGEVVRGYKREQFADAFHRVLGVTSVTAVTSGTSIDAASNGSNACNAVPTKAPHLGHPMYPPTLADAVRDGFITIAEANQQLTLHKLIEAAS